jgi:hypothetical protein
MLYVTATIGPARMQQFCKQSLFAVVAYTAETTCQLTVKHQPSSLRRRKTLCCLCARMRCIRLCVSGVHQLQHQQLYTQLYTTLCSTLTIYIIYAYELCQCRTSVI